MAAQHALRATDDQHRLVYLLDAASPCERRLIEEWIRQRQSTQPAPAYETIALPPSKRPRRTRQQSQLEACLAVDDDPLLAPLRVAWLPPPEDRGRGRRLLRLLVLGDPRDPGRLRQCVGARRQERCRIVAGEPAPLSELRERWQRGAAPTAAKPTASPTSSRGRRPRARARRAAPARRALQGAALRPREHPRARRLPRRRRRLARELGTARGGDDAARRRATCARSPPPTARTSSTSPRTSSTCSTRAATARRCTTTASSSSASTRSRSAIRSCSCPRTSRTSTTSCCSTRCTRTATRRTTPPAAST